MSFFSGFRICFFGLLFYLAASFFSTALALTNETFAKLAAENFVGFLGSSKTILSSQPIKTNSLDSSKPAIISGWLMTLSDGGYILIASSQAFSPVKAYSLKSDYTSLPIQYRKFLESELELYARLETITVSGQRIIQEISPKSMAEKAWEFLTEMNEKDRMVLSYTPDTHLLTTTWNQGYPYNKFLPQIDGLHVLAGCVNTALAQVMKYHGHPSTGAGVTSYSWDNEPLKTILHHPYYWENMPDLPGMASAGHLQDEIAILIRDLAIVNQTSFGINSSSAYLHKNEFVKFFGYSNSLSSMDNTNIEKFFSTLKIQIDQELPVLLSFPGHMVVVDGYASDPTGRKFHINMGWGGSSDDYYYLDENVETDLYIFEPNLNITYNIKPCSGPDCVTPKPPAMDIAPQFNTRFQNIIINTNTNETTPHLTRIDARDENGDQIIFSTMLSNSETITAEITNDILMIKPIPGSLNKAATVRISAEAGGKIIHEDFIVMAINQNMTFGTQQDIMGTFENKTHTDTHQAILEGKITIAGNRGYSNQAFYINVRNSQGEIIIPDADGEEEHPYPEPLPVFPLGLYTISASLTASTGWNYGYTPGDHNDYIIQIAQAEAKATIEQIADLLGVDLTKINILKTGDINNDGQVDLQDKILALKIVTGLGDTSYFAPSNDASGDGRIGIEEAFFWE